MTKEQATELVEKAKQYVGKDFFIMLDLKNIGKKEPIKHTFVKIIGSTSYFTDENGLKTYNDIMGLVKDENNIEREMFLRKIVELFKSQSNS